MNEKMIERVRKLLALSKSENENEAAQAAARAAELMAEHAITAAMVEVVRAGEDSPEHIAETITDRTCTDEQRRVAWRERISGAVAASLYCETYLDRRGNLHAVGRESAVQTWAYVCEYLFREVDRLADAAWLQDGADLAAVGQRPRTWKNGFRVGAADVIYSRLMIERQRADDQRRQLVGAEAAKQLAAGSTDTASSALVLRRAEQAIAVIDRDRAEVKAHFKALTKGFRSARSVGSTSSRSGYSAGREAGKAIDLGAGRRAALPSRI